GLTKSLGKELAKTGVRVNCVTPAAVRTAIFDQMSQQHIDFMLSKIPLGRFGSVGEIAALVCWLASEECSFSTGAVFDLSGGQAAEHDAAPVDFHAAAVQEGDDDKAPFERETLQILLDVIAADHVEHDVGAAVGGDACDFGDEILRPVVDRMGGAHRDAKFCL